MNDLFESRGPIDFSSLNYIVWQALHVRCQHNNRLSNVQLPNDKNQKWHCGILVPQQVDIAHSPLAAKIRKHPQRWIQKPFPHNAHDNSRYNRRQLIGTPYKRNVAVAFLKDGYGNPYSNNHGLHGPDNHDFQGIPNGLLKDLVLEELDVVIQPTPAGFKIADAVKAHLYPFKHGINKKQTEKDHLRRYKQITPFLVCPFASDSARCFQMRIPPSLEYTGAGMEARPERLKNLVLGI